MKNNENVIWRDRKRTIFGLPLSFTVYSLTSEKLLIDTGFLNKKQEEVMLFRIMDITLERKLSQRLFGVGTIHCCSADKTTPEFEIKSVKCPQEVKETLSRCGNTILDINTKEEVEEILFSFYNLRLNF